MAHMKDGLTFITRQRTLCFDLKSVGGPRALGPEWLDLLLKDVGLDPSDIESAGIHGITQHLMVTIFTEELFKAKLALVEKGIKWTKRGGRLVYGWSTEEYLTTVKIVNWSPFMPVEPIIERMKGYGEVVAFHKGTLPDCPAIVSNFIVCKMKLKPGASLPVILRNEAQGEVLQIWWEGGERVCFKCHDRGHLAAFCKQRPSFVPASGPVQDTWAAVCAGTGTPAARHNTKGQGKGAGGNFPPLRGQAGGSKGPGAGSTLSSGQAGGSGAGSTLSSGQAGNSEGPGDASSSQLSVIPDTQESNPTKAKKGKQPAKVPSVDISNSFSLLADREEADSQRIDDYPSSGEQGEGEESVESDGRPVLPLNQKGLESQRSEESDGRPDLPLNQKGLESQDSVESEDMDFTSRASKRDRSSSLDLLAKNKPGKRH
jgi:hypothetical protein